MVVCMLLGVGGFGVPAFALDASSFNGASWPAFSAITANNYTALISNNGVADYLFGTRVGGGLDVVSYSGGWGTLQIDPNVFVAMAPLGVVNEIVAARATGGLTVANYSGGWHTASIDPNAYVSLAYSGGAYQFLAAGANGLVVFYWDFTDLVWKQLLITPTSYSTIVKCPAQPNAVYGIRANGGGIDYVFYNYNVNLWQVRAVSDKSYIAIAPDSTSIAGNRFLFAARSGGGLDGFYNPSSPPNTTWSGGQINSNSYVALEANIGLGSDRQVFGSRAGGGVDAISYDGGTLTWTINSISSNMYGVLLRDPGDLTNMYASFAKKCASASPADFNKDCFVNFTDFVAFAADWLKCGFNDGVCP